MTTSSAIYSPYKDHKHVNDDGHDAQNDKVEAEKQLP